MSYPITQTKVIMPRRHQHLLSRHRLLSMLDDLLDFRLALIGAPAGYGKTTLLVDLADKVEYPVCWLSLDPLDNDPIRFINYFAAAIQHKFPDFGGPSRSLLDNLDVSNLELEQVLQTIINDLYDHVQEHFVLVLDDFHLIDSNPDINQFINRFTQDMDENCHLVIATRSLLGLPDLPLMIGRSQVTGLSFEELAFLPEEIKGLYQLKYQQLISDQDIERILDESEGWITGLLLTAETTQQGVTDQGRAARAAGIDIYDYLACQVLDQQTPEMQEFLLRTALMEEFNEKLCQQVLGEAEGDHSYGELIQHLLQKNLFVQPVESGGTWLRYHHLFRDFLQQHFQKHHPDQAEELLIKLVDVYRDYQWYEKAYVACQQLGDDQRTADYLESVSAALVHRGQLSMLKSWLDDLSPVLIEKNPGLLGNLGAITSMTGDPESGLAMLNCALNMMPTKTDTVVYPRLLIRRATCHRFIGSYQLGLEDAQRALDLSDKIEDGKILVPMAESEIGLNMLGLGLKQEAKELLERSLRSYLGQNDQRNAAFVQMDLGLMEMEEGKYTAARFLYQQAFQLWEELGNFNQLVGLSNNLGVLDHLTGDYLEAFSWFSRALEYARQSSNLRESAYILASLADLALDLGALPRAEIYINESLIIAEQIEDAYSKIYLEGYLQLSMAALARSRGEFKSAKEHLDAVSYRVRENPSSPEMGRYHLAHGQLLFEENRMDLAQDEFRAALEIFSNNNLPVESCLTQLHQAGIDCLGGNLPEAAHIMNSVQEKIQDLGTIHPLVPTFSNQPELLTCLEEHLPQEPFIRDLVREVSAFKARLPNLLEKLGLNFLPIAISQQPLLDIAAMGRVSVKIRGELITVPEWTKQKTVRELFFYLLSYPEGASREEICLEFWPDSQPEQLKKQFKNALYRLRRAVGTDTILYHQPTRLYHFNRQIEYRYDVEDFYKSLDLADVETNPERKVQLLRKAADLYQHPFAPSLEGIWSEPVRYRLHLDYERAMLTIAEGQFSHGNPESALESIEELLVAVPDQEAAWRLAMRAHALKGDRSGIERTYQRCRQALAQDLDVEPSQDTFALYQELMS